jgi:hypothetical protein
MVKVYFETTKDGITSDGRYAELVGIFRNEETYDVCIKALGKLATENRMILTENVEDWNTLEDLTGDEE